MSTATQDGGNNGGLTVENIANKLGVSKRTIERGLSTLQKANIIRHSETVQKVFENSYNNNKSRSHQCPPFPTLPDELLSCNL